MPRLAAPVHAGLSRPTRSRLALDGVLPRPVLQGFMNIHEEQAFMKAIQLDSLEFSLRESAER